MKRPIDETWSLERRFVAAAAAAGLALVWTHAVAALLRHSGPPDAPLAAWPLSIGSALVTLAGAFFWPRRDALLVVSCLGLTAALTIDALKPGALAAAIAVPLTALVAAEAGRRIGSRLPSGVDGALKRRRVTSILWGLVAIAALAQTARLATFMTDSETDWFLTTRHPLWAKHECLPAYLYGAELCHRGVPNPYAPEHYPGLNPEARPSTSMAGMVVEDPYQYPPQFLLLPSLALAATNDYRTVRVLWFATQATLFSAAAFALALWVGGRAGRLAAWLFPLAALSFPMLHALQFGQFHLSAVALSVTALVAFDRGRRATGGALLAAAALAKIFPGLLLVVLAVQRRWRDLGATVAAAVAITAVALATLGTTPFVAFFEEHVPRLANGDAFAFHEVWEEARAVLIADNQGAQGVLLKLQEMGVNEIDDRVVTLGGKLFGLVAIALTALFAFSERRASRRQRAAGWLAVLGLGSLASGGAFGDYVPLTAVWLLTFCATDILRRSPWSYVLAAAGVFQFFLMGTAPVGDWFAPAVMMPLSLVGAALMMTLFASRLAAPLESPARTEASSVRVPAAARLQHSR